MSKLFVVFSFLLLNVVTANAATWNTFNYAFNANKMYFFDAKSVEKQGNNVTLWTKYVNNDAADSDGSYSTATKFVVSCADKTVQELNCSIYDKDHKFMKAFPTPGEVLKVKPNTLLSAVQEAVCTSDFPNNTSNDMYFPVTGNDIYAHAARYYAKAKAKSTDSAPQ